MWRWVAQILHQMVQHPPAGGHAAGRQHDLGAVHGGDGLRFVGRAHHGGSMRHVAHLAGVEPVLARVAREHFGAVDCHRAVEVDRQAAR
jgi:hypothetical protein